MRARSGSMMGAVSSSPTSSRSRRSQVIEVFGLMGVVYLLTRRRVVPDLAARAPERRIAMRETTILLLYAAVGQAAGWILGPALGYRPFSFHIAGTLFGGTAPVVPGELWTWVIFNFHRLRGSAACSTFCTSRSPWVARP